MKRPVSARHAGLTLLIAAWVALGQPAAARAQEQPAAAQAQQETAKAPAQTPGVAAVSDQPINFSHQLHATQNQIPCQYCHIYARRSYSSGVPPVSVCVGCHGTQAIPLAAAGRPETDKVRGHWERGEPIPWVKIHDLPDFVRFPHKAHVNADSARFVDGAGDKCDTAKDPRSTDCRVKLFKEGGDVRCQACHGDVASMPVVAKVDKNFGEMGWCLTCHLNVKGAKERKAGSSTLGAWFGAEKQDAHRETLIGLVNEKGHHNANLTDCTTCHY